MASEEIVVAADNKRKLEEVDNPIADADVDEKVNGDDAKRARVDDGTDGIAGENGHQGEKAEEPFKEENTEQAEDAEQRQSIVETEGKEEKLVTENIKTEENRQGEEPEMAAPENRESEDGRDKSEQENEKSEQPVSFINEGDDAQVPVNVAQETEQPSTDTLQKKTESDALPESEISDGSMMTRKMEVPNNKVGVLIGKAGETIRYLQYNSGAKIQITRDAEADIHSASRPVEIVGTLDQIEKAEKLVNAVIAEADAGGSPALVAKGLATMHAAVASELIEIQVPNEKVGIIIGKGGETIKGLQTRSGARIQIIPQHPEGDESKHRTVRVTGNRKQVEMASDMIKEVMTQTMRPLPGSSNFNQQMHRPRGPAGPPHWGARAPYYGQPTSYDYPPRGPYHHQNTQYSQPPYGNHPAQLAPRSNYGSGWEHRPYQNMQGPRPHTGSYGYFGGPSRPSVHTPAPTASMHPNYSHGQSQGQNYNQAAYPNQNYGQGYNEQGYESQATQYPYGTQGSSQPGYPQAGTQPGYGPPQQYAKPPSSYSVPTQATPSSGQPGELSYQATVPSSQSYASNVPSQQTYPYASSVPAQQTYPSYGSATSTDIYNQPQPAVGSAGYSQPPVQPVQNFGQPAVQQAPVQPVQSYGQPAAQQAPAQTAPGYGQPLVQQAPAQPAPVYGQHPAQQVPAQPAPVYGQPPVQQTPAYAQVAPGSYGTYPAPQGYTEQSNNASYAYQGQQDGYATGAVQTYNAAPSAQSGYTQATPSQPNYDQAGAQSGGYGSVAGATG